MKAILCLAVLALLVTPAASAVAERPDPRCYGPGVPSDACCDVEAGSPWLIYVCVWFHGAHPNVHVQ